MDANGLRFWLLADRAHWTPDAAADYDESRRRLRLRSARDLPPDPAAPPSPLAADGAPTALDGAARATLAAAARDALAVVPQARDAVGTHAWWDAARRQVLAAGALPDAVPRYAPPAGEAVTDLAVGYDGVLYLAVGGRVVLHDLRGRWSDVTLEAPGFLAARLAADPAGGVWVLDRASQQLGHVHGLPLPDRPPATYGPETARPCAENPAPPRLEPLPRATWGAHEAVAIAASPAGRLAVLAWAPDGDAALHLAVAHGRLDLVTRLAGARVPYALAWVGEDRVAVRATTLPREALVYDVADALATTRAVGEVYPLRDAPTAPFAHGLDLPPHYPTVVSDVAGATAPLHALSAPAYAHVGAATAGPIDGREAGMVWHRLYLEAVLPPHAGLRVSLAATDDPTAPTDARDWHDHVVGDVPGGAGPRVPRAAWVPLACELPFHDGLLDCPRARDRAGLFTVLVQRAGRRVSTLRGRYLWVRVTLHGDGRASPELAALRAWGGRFSYVDHYLPALYREALFAREAEAPVAPGTPSTPADFLERFLDNVEGVLTPLEDRVGHAHLLTDPRTVPDRSLEWLASWTGVTFEPAYPTARRRTLLAESPALFRARGTYAGLRRALDVATDGGCARGQIIVLELYRLRRTFATILGADLADERDPLLGGLVVSGNSVVGDTLILGDEERRDFLALFGAQALTARGDTEAVAAFLDALTYRVAVLVHQETAPLDLGLIRRVVALEKPAHVAAEVMPARHALVVGLASLVGIDTALGPPVPRGVVRVERSAVGVRDVLTRLPSLDPRLDGGAPVAALPAPARPTARLTAPRVVPRATAFQLDGSGSRAAPEHTIARYSWTMLR